LNIFVKRTSELNIDEQVQIVELFNTVFSKYETVDFFLSKYYWTNVNGSYHAIMKDNEKIIGCYSVIPYKYRFYDDDVVFGLSVDTMIDEKYRGNPFNFKKMANALYEKLLLDDVSLVFGFPNENVYLVRKKILKWIDIGSLDFYILPIRVGKLRANLKLGNWASRFLAYLMVRYTQLTSIRSQKPLIYKIKMSDVDSEYFISKRYSKVHRIISDETGFFVYRTSFENNALVAYIVDVQPLEQGFFERAVNKIYKIELHIDAIIFIGKLPFHTRNMMKVPQRYAPKAIRLSGLILDRSKIDERVFDIASWQVGLVNFDVR
jgi:hypothetical protein